MGVIYKITSPSGKMYVGKTYNLRLRKAAHKYAAKKGMNIALHNSIRKYGWDNHVLEVIEECNDDLLNEREMFWIKELKTYYKDSPLGLNMSVGGEGNRYSWMHDVERRKKQSERFSGSGGNFYGKHHTEENKKAQSVRMKAYNLSIGRRVPQWGAEKGWDAVKRKCLVYDTNGDLVNKFLSLTECAKHLKLSVGLVKDAIRRNSWIQKKYTIRYDDGAAPLKIEVGVITYQSVSRPVCLLSEDLEIINTFPSAKEAADFFGLPKTTINRAAMYNWGKPIRTGHQFIYKNLYEELVQEVA